MKMKHGKISAAGKALIAVGVVVGLGGLVFVGMYAHSIFSVLDEPDKSAIFWHTPLLFMGLVGVGAGISLVIGGRIRRSKD